MELAAADSSVFGDQLSATSKNVYEESRIGGSSDISDLVFRRFIKR